MSIYSILQAFAVVVVGVCVISFILQGTFTLASRVWFWAKYDDIGDENLHLSAVRW